MGYAGKLREKAHVIELRKQGLSYKDIKNKVHVSKDSISRWCSNIELSAEQKLVLTNNQYRGGIKGSIKAAFYKKEQRKVLITKYFQAGKDEIGTISKRERFLIGIALYLAEGTKYDSKFQFTNSNPRLILCMIHWLREFCQIEEKRVHVALYLHEENNLEQSMNFWSSLTGIPLNQFHKSYIVVRKSKYRKNIYSHGIASVRYTDVILHRRLMGWIAGILQ